MKHFATIDYWDCYNALPLQVQDLADKSFALLKENPRHPSLLLKTVGEFVSARIGLSWRALATKDGEDLLWFWIGSHAEYDKLLK